MNKKEKEFKSYVESIIRDHTGEYPTDYLTNGIVQKAIELFYTHNITCEKCKLNETYADTPLCKDCLLEIYDKYKNK